jgi:hypothetical protein
LHITTILWQDPASIVIFDALILLFSVSLLEEFSKCVSGIGCSIFLFASVILSPNSHVDFIRDKAKFP